VAKHTDASLSQLAYPSACPGSPAASLHILTVFLRTRMEEGSASLSDGYQGAHLTAEKSNIDQGAPRKSEH